MIAETQGLTASKALQFALGCMAAAVWQRLYDERFETAIRWCLALGVGTWAATKLIIPFLVIVGEAAVTQETVIGLLLAALCYGIIALGLIIRRPNLWMVGLIAAFAINSVPTLLSIMQLAPASELQRALSAEESLAWGMLVIVMIGWRQWQQTKATFS